MKYAIVDLGSNTVRLSIYQALEQGAFALLFSEKEIAGLASYINNGVLSQDGIRRAWEVLLEFQTLIKQFSMRELHVFATASLRNIQNTDEAVQKIRCHTGLQVDVISGQEEAELGYYGALVVSGLKECATLDIGGGSMEVSQVRQGKILQAQSLDVGCLNLFHRYVSKIWPNKTEMGAMKVEIGEKLSQLTVTDRMEQVCCIGGTARAVLSMANLHFDKAAENCTLTAKELEKLTKFLTARSKGARKLILRTCPDRLHTILPGALLLRQTVDWLGASRLYISKYGVREGYLCRKLLNA